MIKKDSIKFSGKIPIKGQDYEETDDTFTIFNVPILAEMVQTYTDGVALKSKDEILKVQVNNVPLTIVDDAPTHPNHLMFLNTLGKKDVTVGYMSEPARPRSNMKKTKRYADFVLYNTPKISALKDVYLSGSYIDTSIGFDSESDKTPGKWNGQNYDYVQRNIVLDHNAILIDRIGNVGIGRMPSPIGGIGADNMNTDENIEISINNMVNKLKQQNPDLETKDLLKLIDTELDAILWDETISNELINVMLNDIANNLIINNENITNDNVYAIISRRLWEMRETKYNTSDDEFIKEKSNRKDKSKDSVKKFRSLLINHLDNFNKNTEDEKMSDELKIKIDSLEKENADLKKQIADSKKQDSVKEIKVLEDKADSIQKESDKMKIELKDAQDELTSVKSKLQVYLDAEEEELKTKKDELKAHYADLAELFDKADVEFINKKYDELKAKKDKSSTIGADLMGPSTLNNKKEQTNFEKVYSVKKE